MIWERTREEVIVRTNFMSFSQLTLQLHYSPPQKKPPPKSILDQYATSRPTWTHPASTRVSPHDDQLPCDHRHHRHDRPQFNSQQDGAGAEAGRAYRAYSPCPKTAAPTARHWRAAHTAGQHSMAAARPAAAPSAGKGARRGDRARGRRRRRKAPWDRRAGS